MSSKNLGILFLQIGDDRTAARYLAYLDDDLAKKTGGVDIVDTKKASEVDNHPQGLLGCLKDAYRD